MVVHDRNCAVETNRRTMNFQRTVRCALTVSPEGQVQVCVLPFRSIGSLAILA
jgi:hypothetical protein